MLKNYFLCTFSFDYLSIFCLSALSWTFNMKSPTTNSLQQFYVYQRATNMVDQAFSNHECNATMSSFHCLVLGQGKTRLSFLSMRLPASHPLIWCKWWCDRKRKDSWRQKNSSHWREHPPRGGILHLEKIGQPTRSHRWSCTVLCHYLEYPPEVFEVEVVKTYISRKYTIGMALICTAQNRLLNYHISKWKYGFNTTSLQCKSQKNTN